MFVHLHNHTEFSIADGLFAPKKWVEAIADAGFKGHALTDHGNVGGHLPFYKAMKDKKLTPLLGCEFYFVDDPLEKIVENRRSSHLILLAQNYDGYRNLLKLQALSYEEGFYFRPRIGLKWLKEYHEGLVCLTACLGGVLSTEVWREFAANDAGTMYKGLEDRFRLLYSIFSDDLYVEFQGHELDEQVRIQTEFYNRLRNLPGFQHVITNDCHYILPEHAPIQTMLKDSAYKKQNTEAGQSYTTTDSLWLKPPLEVLKSFLRKHTYMPKEFVLDGMRRTEEVFDKCSKLELPSGQRYLPRYRTEIDSKEHFKALTVGRLREFLKSDLLRAPRQDYIDRFAKEYKTISKYDLEDYFLIVWDIVRFAQERGIYTGLGRGSAAGSLISYLLGIVRIDPLEHGLFFERFLNENRCENGELPDIDLDFESSRREEVKEYIYQTYGHDKVCEIGTYGRMKLKTGIIDFGTMLGVSDRSSLLKITTALELDRAHADNLDEAMAVDPALQNLVEKNPQFGFSIRELLGQIKSQGVHPAGVLIANQPIDEIAAVKTQRAKDSGEKERIRVTQSEDKYLIAQGLVKMDVLGIKEYDQLRYVVENAPDKPFTMENYVERIMDDERDYQAAKARGVDVERKYPIQTKVWEMFSSGQTDGVFQFASDGMRELLRLMEANTLNDLIAANALYRPGCLENGWHTLYCKRKSGEEAVAYVHPDLKQALGSTYGVIVFQEQFMEAIHKLGSIPLVDADTIRSALGKKDKDKLAKFKGQFVSGAESKIGKSEAEEVWDQIEKASGYTFNRSHSAAYSTLAYLSQYMKVRYPGLYWAAQLHWDTAKNKHDEVLLDRRAAQDMGIEFKLPSINTSKSSFYVETASGKIVWSLIGVKGVAENTAKEIEAHQPFSSFEDFQKRVNKSKVRWNHMVSLAYAGLFDEFGDRREIVKLIHEQKKKPVPSLSEQDMIFAYYEQMGFFERKLKRVFSGFDSETVTERDLVSHLNGADMSVGGMITAVKRITTKNGDRMGFLTLSDLDESIDVTVFPDQWSKHVTDLKVGNIVEIWGQKNNYRGSERTLELRDLKVINTR